MVRSEERGRNVGDRTATERSNVIHSPRPAGDGVGQVAGGGCNKSQKLATVTSRSRILLEGLTGPQPVKKSIPILRKPKVHHHIRKSPPLV